MIVASDLPVLDVLNTFRPSWAIESAFSLLKSRGLRGAGDAHDGPSANLSSSWAAVYRTDLDDSGGGTADRDPCPSAGQTRASGRECDADRVADAHSGGAVGRR